MRGLCGILESAGLRGTVQLYLLVYQFIKVRSKGEAQVYAGTRNLSSRGGELIDLWSVWGEPPAGSLLLQQCPDVPYCLIPNLMKICSFGFRLVPVWGCIE